MSTKDLNSYIKEYLRRQPRSLSMSQMEELIEYDAWLDARRPTMRAAVLSDAQAFICYNCGNTLEQGHREDCYLAITLSQSSGGG